MIGEISEREELQFDINRAFEWSGSSKLNFNFDKFSILEFSCKNTHNSSTELFAKGIAIKNKKQIKDLGLIFTASMTWNCHLEMAVKKSFQKLIHLRRVIPRTTKNCQMHVGEKIYILCGLLCIKCLEPRTTLSSTLGKTAEIMFKIDNLPFCSR